MKSPKTLLYALLTRIGVGVYAFRKLGVRDPKLGLLGAILGLAGGVYLDRGRAERDLGDNLAFGLIVSAFLRLADILYGISMLTPQSRKMGLIVLSLVAMGSALTSEASFGRPGRIPILGILAILVAFLLVFSAVHTQTITTTITRYSGGSLGSGGGYAGYQAFYKVYNSTSGTSYGPIRFDVANSSSYTLALSYSGYDKLVYLGVPIRTNRSNIQLQPGDIIEVKVILSQNVTKPYFTTIYYLPDGSRTAFDEIPGDTSSSNDTRIFRFTVRNIIQLSIGLRISIDRNKLGSEYFPDLPITVSISRAKVAEKDVSKTYLIGAMIMLIIATIDALPIDSTRKITRRTRRKKRKARKR